MFGWRKERKIKSRILTLINLAEQLGLNEKDITNAKECLEYNELELSFDCVITQTHEYDVAIDKAFYSMVTAIASELKLPANEYDFLIPLIKKEVF
jgi:ADP-dependent phosphofructokinase/glucokinase